MRHPTRIGEPSVSFYESAKCYEKDPHNPPPHVVVVFRYRVQTLIQRNCLTNPLQLWIYLMSTSVSAETEAGWAVMKISHRHSSIPLSVCDKVILIKQVCFGYSLYFLLRQCLKHLRTCTFTKRVQKTPSDTIFMLQNMSNCFKENPLCTKCSCENSSYMRLKS